MLPTRTDAAACSVSNAVSQQVTICKSQRITKFTISNYCKAHFSEIFTRPRNRERHAVDENLKSHLTTGFIVSNDYGADFETNLPGAGGAARCRCVGSHHSFIPLPYVLGVCMYTYVNVYADVCTSEGIAP